MISLPSSVLGFQDEGDSTRTLCALRCSFADTTLGYLAKLGFSFKIKARVKILPQAYKYYSEDKIYARNAELGRKDNFSR